MRFLVQSYCWLSVKCFKKDVTRLAYLITDRLLRHLSAPRERRGRLVDSTADSLSIININFNTGSPNKKAPFLLKWTPIMTIIKQRTSTECTKIKINDYLLFTMHMTKRWELLKFCPKLKWHNATSIRLKKETVVYTDLARFNSFTRRLSFLATTLTIKHIFNILVVDSLTHGSWLIDSYDS